MKRRVIEGIKYGKSKRLATTISRPTFGFEFTPSKLKEMNEKLVAEHFNLELHSVKAFKAIILRDLESIRRRIQNDQPFSTNYAIRIKLKTGEMNFRMTIDNVENFKEGIEEPIIHLTRIPEE